MKNNTNNTRSFAEPFFDNAVPKLLNATQRNATQRNATQRNATQRNATQRNANLMMPPQ